MDHYRCPSRNAAYRPARRYAPGVSPVAFLKLFVKMSFGFEIIRELGAGGHGDLFLARRADTGAQVVVKYLRECQDPESRRTFHREIRILERNLYGLVRILGSDQISVRPFYVMPYLPGGTLTGWVGRLSENQISALASKMATTLGGLHQNVISHGDVKPDYGRSGSDASWRRVRRDPGGAKRPPQSVSRRGAFPRRMLGSEPHPVAGGSAILGATLRLMALADPPSETRF